MKNKCVLHWNMGLDPAHTKGSEIESPPHYFMPAWKVLTISFKSPQVMQGPEHRSSFRDNSPLIYY